VTTPQIDFYISTAAALEQRLVLACRLADKAFRAGHRVYLHCANVEQTQQLDDLLWSFQTSSFVPHAVIDNGVGNHTGNEPVRIGCGQSIWNNQDVLINLDQQVPESFAQFARVLEIVVQNADVLDNTREHWRYYKQLGHNPQRRELEKS
jgi:DNA polymerase-3 subunit chi